MGVKAQSGWKKIHLFIVSKEQQAACWLFMYSVSRYSIFILFARLLLITCSFHGKLFLLFMSIFTHLTVLQGKDTVRLRLKTILSLKICCAESKIVLEDQK